MVCSNDIRLSHCGYHRSCFLCPVVQAERGYEGIDAACRPVSERPGMKPSNPPNTPTNLDSASTCGFCLCAHRLHSSPSYTACLTLGCIFGALSFVFYYLSLSNFYEMGQWPRKNVLDTQFFTNEQVRGIVFINCILYMGYSPMNSLCT